ncbi:hypothetical protein [Mycoplasmoides gallisepticum]|uniref:hypothetical protein n=1 Tax=Mycoplasmoides gallisepticum TaxID=2096 RepID=UPI0033621821
MPELEDPEGECSAGAGAALAASLSFPCLDESFEVASAVFPCAAWESSCVWEREPALLCFPADTSLVEDLGVSFSGALVLASDLFSLLPLGASLDGEEVFALLSDGVVFTAGEEWLSCCFWGDCCWAVCRSASGFVTAAGLCWASLCELDSLYFCPSGVDVDVVTLVKDVFEVELLDDADWVDFVCLAVAGLLVEGHSVVVTEGCSLLDGVLAGFWSVVWDPLDPLATVLDPLDFSGEFVLLFTDLSDGLEVFEPPVSWVEVVLPELDETGLWISEAFGASLCGALSLLVILVGLPLVPVWFTFVPVWLIDGKLQLADTKPTNEPIPNKLINFMIFFLLLISWWT